MIKQSREMDKIGSSNICQIGVPQDGIEWGWDSILRYKDCQFLIGKDRHFQIRKACLVWAGWIQSISSDIMVKLQNIKEKILKAAREKIITCKG